MESLQETLHRVRAGDRDAYSAIVSAYQDMLLAYAAFRVPDSALVDEVVQQTFIRAYEQLSDYQPEKDFGVWLRAICKYMILAELTRAVRDRENREGYQAHLRRRLLETALEREGAAPSADLLPALETCLGKLQEKSRALVRYRYEEALKIEEIARRVGESVAWVATTLFRVREALRRCMEEQAAPA